MHGRAPQQPPPVLVRLTVTAIAAVLAVCLVVGAFGALVGGSAARVGEGAGGLGGFPPLVLLGTAALLGLPAAVLAARRGQLRTAALVRAGPLAGASTAPGCCGSSRKARPSDAGRSPRWR